MDHSKIEVLIKGLIEKSIIEKLTNDFKTFDQFLITKINFPPIPCTSYVELEVLINEMMGNDISNQEQWKYVENFGKNKYRLHQ